MICSCYRWCCHIQTYKPFFYLYFLWENEDVVHIARWNGAELDWAGLSRNNQQKVFLYRHEGEHKKDFSLCSKERRPRRCCFVRGRKKCLWSTLKRLKTPGLHRKITRAIWSSLFGKKKKTHFICDPGESRYEPGALMKRAEYPANTLTGPRWLLGNKAKWLLSDLVCLSTAVPHLWLWALLLSG